VRFPLIAVAASLLASACAGGTSSPPPGSSPAPAPAPAPAAATVMKQAAQVEAPKPKPFDPTGIYSVSLTYGGMPLVLTLQLAKRTDGSFAGAITVDQVPQPIPLNTVDVKDNAVIATLSAPDGASVTMKFTISGDDLAGSYSTSTGDGSAISGKKLP